VVRNPIKIGLGPIPTVRRSIICLIGVKNIAKLIDSFGFAMGIHVPEL